MAKAKWCVGQKFVHRPTGSEFLVDQVVVLPPEGRVGYLLKPVDGGLPELRLFEPELDIDFEQVENCDVNSK